MADFEVKEQVHIDVAPLKDATLNIPKFTSEAEAKVEAKKGEASPEDVMVNTLLVKACYTGLCNLAYSFTQVEEAQATDNETEVLAAAWGPILPKLSPVTLAAVATIGVLAPKACVVVVKYRTTKKGASQHGDAKQGTTGAVGQDAAVEVAKAQLASS